MKTKLNKLRKKLRNLSKKEKLYISAAALALLTVVLIITLIYSVGHRAAPPETSPSPEPEPASELQPSPRPTARPAPSPTPAPTPAPTPSPSPSSGSVATGIPAITPPAITSMNPASSSDIILQPVKPSTNSDIDIPVPGDTGGKKWTVNLFWKKTAARPSPTFSSVSAASAS